jgi:tetratricopeptide (TPR) repeat protein
MAFSPDSRRVLAGGDSSDFRLFDVTTGNELHRFYGHTGYVNALAFSPDGRRVLSVAGDKTMRLWDVDRARQLRVFPHPEIVICVAFSPDGRLALSGGEDKVIRLWDLGTAKEIRQLPGHPVPVRCLAFSPDGRRILSGSDDGTMRLWDVETGKEICPIKVSQTSVWTAAFSPSGQEVISGDNRGVRLWDVETGQEVRQFQDPKLKIVGGLEWIVVAPDGRRALSTDHFGRKLQLWDVDTGKELRCLYVEPPMRPQKGVISPDGRLAACGNWRGSVSIWRLTDPLPADEALAEARETLAAKRSELGDEHPETLRALDELATLLRDESRPAAGAEAELLYRQSLETKRRVLGPDHPDTLLAMKTLALLLGSRGKPAEAEPLCRQVWEGWRRALGAEHIDALLALQHLVDVLEAEGNRVEAAVLCHQWLWDAVGPTLGPQNGDMVAMRERLARLVAQLRKDGRAEAYFTRLMALRPKDPQHWIERGHSLAALGQHQKADDAFARAAMLNPDELHGFIAAGWWVVGPYPEDLRLSCPPEKDPDPSRPVAAVGNPPGSGGKAATAVPHTLTWQHVPFEQHFLRVELGPLFNNADHISAYALTYVFSPEERSATLLVGGGEAVRLWVNGRLVHEGTQAAGAWEWRKDRVPVTLRAGRNTLLVKVSKSTRRHTLCVRIVDNPMHRGLTLAQLGLWEEAVPLIARGYGREESWGEAIWRFHFHALLCRATDDVEGYRQLCQQMLDHLGSTSDASATSMAAQTCALAPEGCRDPAALLRLAEQMATDTDIPWVQFALGLTYYRAGHFEQAIQRLSKPRCQGWAKAWAVLAMAHHRLGHVEEARKWLTKLDAWSDKATREVLEAPVFGLRSLGGWDEVAHIRILHREAKVLIEGSAQKADANWKALQARAQEELQRRNRATADHDHALGLFPDQPRLWLARGRRFAELRQWDKADADLAKAAELKPDDPTVWRERGRIYAEFGKYDKAAADFGKALALSPSSSDPWFEPGWNGRGAIVEDLVRWEEVFDRVVKQRPRDTHWWIACANHFGRRGQWQQAAAALAKVIDLDPSDPWAGYYIPAVYLQLGDREGYRRACRAMLTRFGGTKDPSLAERTAKTCLLAPDASGALKRATELAEQAVTGTEHDGNYSWFLMARGLADYRNGRFAGALAWIDKCLAANAGSRPAPLDASAWLIAAMAQHRLGRHERAAEALDKAGKLWHQQADGDLGLDWDDWLRFQLLRREAEVLMRRTQKGSDSGGR